MLTKEEFDNLVLVDRDRSGAFVSPKNGSIALSPCPFCGRIDDTAYETSSWQHATKLNKKGNRFRAAEISYCVVCYYCGARGPSGARVGGDYGVEIITHLEASKALELAAIAWNVRAGHADEVFSAIADAIRATFGKSP